MEKAKENNGITLVSLIITIVIMLILVSVTTYSGINSYKNAKVTQFVTQMQLIQKKVDELVTANEYSNLGTSAEAYQGIITSAHNSEEINSNDAQDFKYFSINSLKDLDLENIDTPVLINFETREVVSTNGVNYKNRTYYTQYLLPQGQALVEYTGMQRQSINFEVTKELNGLNCLVNITGASPNCTITYGEGATALEVTQWKTISNYTKANDNDSVNISKSGTYIFKIQDNENNVNPETQTINIITTNKPNTLELVSNYDYALSKEHWARLDGYTWIPRFAYNTSDSSLIKYIKGNSNIATDNTYINSSNWSTPSIFTKNNAELTGVWVLTTDIIQNFGTFEEEIEDMETDIEKIAYILENGNITGRETISSTSHLEHEIFNKESETVFDATNQYLIPVTGENDDPIRLFSAENINKNFMISFNKISVVDDGTIYNKNTAPTLLAEMDESSTNNTLANGSKMYPGFAIKLMTIDGVNQLIIESNSYTNTTGDVTIPDDVTNVRILRMEGFLYYSFDGGNFIKLNDYTSNINPFNVPLIFGAGIDEKGKTFRYFKGIISDVSVKFIDDIATIDDYNPPEEEVILTTVYAHEGAIEFRPDANGIPKDMIDVETGQNLPVTSYQHDGMIYTGLSMFEEETVDTDFEISFVIKKIATKSEGQVGQGAIVNVKYEKTGWKGEDWPGFVYRLTKDCGSVELTARGHTSGNPIITKISNLNPINEQDSGREIKISRRNRKVFYSIDGVETMAYDFDNFNYYFDNVPITIGGSLNNEGVTNQPWRGFKGILSNIVVKVEE